MRRYQCHHYNSAIERVNLRRSQGGRGLCSFPLDHDRVVVNLARYVHTANDPLTAQKGAGVLKAEDDCVKRSQIDTWETTQ